MKNIASCVEGIYSNQEEADRRMILHASCLSKAHGRIIICCDDTEVLVLSILLNETRVFAKFDQFVPVRSHFDTKRPVNFT